MRVVALDERTVGQHLVYDVVDGAGRILLPAGARITLRHVDILRRRGYVTIPVRDPLSGHADAEDILPSETRRRVTAEVRAGIDRAAQGALVVTHGLRSAVGAVLDAVTRTGALTCNLHNLHAPDTFFYVHAVNVCTYALMISTALALDPVDRRHLGIGALLHDIGLVGCRDLLDKPEFLTPEERERMQQHPAAGFEMLRRQTEVDLRAAHCVFQHHERLDGSGYPRRLAGTDISSWGMVVAIAEAFDSMTSTRVYARGRPAAAALDVLEADAASGRLDPYLVRHFVQRVSRYPAGTIVRLGDGAVGVVAQPDVPGHAPARVRIVSEDGETLTDGAEPRDIQGDRPGRSVAACLADYPEALHPALRERAG